MMELKENLEHSKDKKLKEIDLMKVLGDEIKIFYKTSGNPW